MNRPPLVSIIYISIMYIFERERERKREKVMKRE
jgi:hypothetical protein